MHIKAAHLLVAFLIVFNILDQRAIGRLKKTTDPRARIRVYRFIFSWLWAATIAAAWLMGPQELFWAHRDRLSVSWLPGPVTAGIVAIAAFLALVGPLILLQRKPGAAANLSRALDKLRFFLPHTPEERRWWVLLSITAGVCEESLFRSFLLQYLHNDPWRLDLGLAIFIACVFFALGHLYQGPIAAIGTGVLAVLFFVLFLGSGNLLLPMFLHAITDLRALFLLRLAEKTPAQT